MAITIVATVGSASANSYATEAEFIAYAATLAVVPTSTTVTGSTCTEDEKKALVMAFRALNNFQWLAERVDATQAGAWPRYFCPNPDAPNGATVAEAYYASTVVPTRVKHGQIELALAIRTSGTTDLFAADADTGVIEETVGPLTTRWSPYARAIGLAKYPQAFAYIGPLLDSGAGALEIARV